MMNARTDACDQGSRAARADWNSASRAQKFFIDLFTDDFRRPSGSNMKNIVILADMFLVVVTVVLLHIWGLPDAAAAPLMRSAGVDPARGGFEAVISPTATMALKRLSVPPLDARPSILSAASFSFSKYVGPSAGWSVRSSFQAQCGLCDFGLCASGGFGAPSSCMGGEGQFTRGTRFQGWSQWSKAVQGVQAEYSVITDTQFGF